MAVNKNVAKAKKSATSEKCLIKYFKDLKAEFKRITWASKADVKKATATVITFCFLYAVFVGLLDYGFSNIMKMIFK